MSERAIKNGVLRWLIRHASEINFNVVKIGLIS